LIPDFVLAREDLTHGEMIIYGIILGLSSEKSYCFASNDYLSTYVGRSSSRVSAIISSLVDKGLVNRELIRKENNEVIERRLFPLFGIDAPLPLKIGGGIPKNSGTSPQKQLRYNKNYNKNYTLSKDKGETKVSLKKESKKGSGYNSVARKEIDSLTSYLKQKLNLKVLDGTVENSRRYCFMCAKKFGGSVAVREIVDCAAYSSYWRTKISSWQDIYYHGVKIGKEKPPKALIFNAVKKGGVWVKPKT